MNANMRQGWVECIRRVHHRPGDKPRARSKVADWIRKVAADGIAPAEIGIFARSNDHLAWASAAVKAAGHTQVEVSERVEQRVAKR